MRIPQPLGLPNGSVRSLIAMAFTTVTCFLWATAQVVPNELLVINTLVLTFYFKTRDEKDKSEAELIELPEPYPGDDN